MSIYVSSTISLREKERVCRNLKKNKTVKNENVKKSFFESSKVLIMAFLEENITIFNHKILVVLFLKLLFAFALIRVFPWFEFGGRGKGSYQGDKWKLKEKEMHGACEERVLRSNYQAVMRVKVGNY